ncbi:hypothetical protein SBOR_9803 [Sclerotinia borealis F-4128]|uniref:Uncharacterized protein n=1 Tax=Sclerotinia borealis (strain F-4128) TaxID=1432307 RepID=W9BZ23_SCLBF|nr:hypothetical protein SBOR_9803 [Sclerotinia borealis F-4128]
MSCTPQSKNQPQTTDSEAHPIQYLVPVLEKKKKKGTLVICLVLHNANAGQRERIIGNSRVKVIGRVLHNGRLGEVDDYLTHNSPMQTESSRSATCTVSLLYTNDVTILLVSEGHRLETGVNKKHISHATTDIADRLDFRLLSTDQYSHKLDDLPMRSE